MCLPSLAHGSSRGARAMIAALPRPFKPSVEPGSRLAYGARVTHTAEVVIVGAGIMGVSTAYHLARLGVGPVVVLERDTVCSGSTALASGGIRHQYANRLGVELTTHSIVTYER